MSRRSSNFSKGEVDYLLKLIEARKHVLECRKIDRKSSEEKVKAWIEIELEFNKKLGHNFRNAEALRTKYKNLKKSKKTCSAKKFTPTTKFAGQFENLVDIDSFYEDDTIDTQDKGEDSIESLPSVDIRKAQIHEQQISDLAKEHNAKMKRQELEISILEKEHHLKIAKMELEIHILETQLHQKKKENNNIIYDP
ncbi:uncharacterized protein LOC105665574 [Ceratitis capitata]|uniref:Regulatory protein zeste n=1 Tax=Ceratitis capitata TaxID=7213 RepID=W8AJK6_CERCA|nr:uncharacterized protein LOC105665574 [Ceratitis capitata]